MDCPRHWRRFAIRQYRRLVSTLPHRLTWVHVRLTLPERLKPGKPQPHVGRWSKAVKAHLPDAALVCVTHRGTASDHYHVAVGSDGLFDLDVFRAFWKAHRPHKRAYPWSDGWVFAETRPNPKRLVYYFLTRDTKQNPNNPVCPWSGLRGRPVRKR
jgi:hypothetical protein